MPHSLRNRPASPLVLPQVRTIGLLRPLAWLALALRDIARAPLLSLAHGLVLALLGAAILSLGYNRFWFVAGTLSGFLIVGPMLATSLYAISRALERGERVTIRLPEVGRIEAHLIWTTEGRAGFQFERIIRLDDFMRLIDKIQPNPRLRRSR